MNYTGTKGFVVIEFLMYLGYLCLDLKGLSGASSYIKFLSILLCFFWITYCSFRFKKEKIIPMALGFSVLSDIFLLFTNNFVPGIFCFLIVQTLFLMLLNRREWVNLKVQFGIRLLLPVIILLFFHFLNISMDGVLILAVFYIISFAANVFAAIHQMLLQRENYALQLFAAGLFLFFLCDINVGIFNLSSYVQADSMILTRIIDFASIGMWLFYLPGQILIGISNIFSISQQKTTCRIKSNMIQ